MRLRDISIDNPRIQAAVKDLQELILQKYPMAQLSVYEGDDPAGIYIDAVVDLDDPDEVLDHVLARMIAYQDEEDIPVHVIPLRTPERDAAVWAAQRRGKVI
jgi:hypothetical protein